MCNPHLYNGNPQKEFRLVKAYSGYPQNFWKQTVDKRFLD